MPAHRPMEERFWSKVDKDGPIPTGHPEYEGLGPCWRFIGSNMIAYPFSHLRSGGQKQKILAHRYSYELHFGPAPDGMVVRHRCDNGGCVNPGHLVIGTHADNSADRARRRTGPFRTLFPSQVTAARKARAYGVPIEVLRDLAHVETHTMNCALYEERTGNPGEETARRFHGANGITAEQLQDVWERVVAGATLRTAALAIGKEWGSVRDALTRSGLDYAALDMSRKTERDARIVELYRGGMSALAVGKAIGISQPTVRAALQRAGAYEGKARQGNHTRAPERRTAREAKAGGQT